MRLKSLKFSEEDGTPQEWRLETLSFGSRMLLVGKNAAGKSRALSVVSSLANYVTGAKPLSVSGNYSATFDWDGREYVYALQYRDAQVQREEIVIDGKSYLSRGLGGIGHIRAEKVGSEIDFQVPPNSLGAVARRDGIQHGFIEPLFEWGSSLRYYQFGGMQKGVLALFVPRGMPVDDRDQNAVVAIFREGLKQFGNDFTNSIKRDLADVDYQVEEIVLAPPISVRFLPGGPEPVAINVKEMDLQGFTDQIGMSEGMFRVLAILVHVNFAQFKGSASSVFIDDVGEGLDFDRSCRLIDLLRSKAERHSFQLVMSTNDKFVMNQVPLEEWTVLHRSRNVVHVRNYGNSRKAFDDFRFTGLSNFSFFEMNAIEMSREMSSGADADA